MYKRGAIREFILVLSTILLFTLIAPFVFAAIAHQPEGPDTLNVTESGRRTLSASAVVIDAEAGNVTAMEISHETITEAWQGYYGNITGTITLDDANNVTMYDWELDPEGEIFAVNGTYVRWPSVYCINVSQNGTVLPRPDGEVSNINGSQIELNYGINSTDLDGLNETFNGTYTNNTGFWIGSVHINGTDGCSMAHPFVNENHNNEWEELLLSDNSTLIFTTILKVDKNMYKTVGSETADFEMLVLENGHVGSEDISTPYYFFVEIS